MPAAKSLWQIWRRGEEKHWPSIWKEIQNEGAIFTKAYIYIFCLKKKHFERQAPRIGSLLCLILYEAHIFSFVETIKFLLLRDYFPWKGDGMRLNPAPSGCRPLQLLLPGSTCVASRRRKRPGFCFVLFAAKATSGCSGGGARGFTRSVPLPPSSSDYLLG